MPVTSFAYEVSSPVAPARLFKAMVLNAHTLIPKLFPDAAKSIDVVQGRGGAPAVVHPKFHDGKHAKLRYDVVDKENFYSKCTLIEGGEGLKDGVESIVYENKFEASPDGGSLFKRTTEVHSAAQVKEEDFKASDEKAEEALKAVEAYLLENPTA